MENKFGLRPISRQKGISQSIGNQSVITTPSNQNNFRIKNVSTPYDSSLSISGQQIKSDSAIFDHNHSNMNYMLHMIDLNQSEQQITTLIKTEIAMIQQEINEFDKDIKIRSNSIKQEFNKGHIHVFKRWLLANQRSVLKHNEIINQDFSKAIIPEVLAEQLKVDSKDQCIHKLYRIIQGLDLFLLKLTEYLTITYMKYEDFVSKNLPQDAHIQVRVNNLIKGATIYPNNITAIHQDRFNLLCKHYQQKQQECNSIKSQSKQLSGTPFNPVTDAPKSEIKAIPDFIKYLENLKPNTLMNSEFLKVIKGHLSQIEQNSLLKQQKQDQILQKQSESLLTYKVQIDQLEKQVTYLSDQNSQQKTSFQKQLDEQEAEHVKQVELMQNDLQSQIQAQIQEKVNSLNKQIQEQDIEMKKIQVQYQEMLTKYKEKQNSLAPPLKDVNKENQQPVQTQQSQPEEQQKMIQMIEDLKNDYLKTIEVLRAEAADFKQKFLDMKVNNETTYQELLNLKQLYAQLLKDKEEMTLKISQKFMSKQEFTDTFEQALKEEVKSKSLFSLTIFKRYFNAELFNQINQ